MRAVYNSFVVNPGSTSTKLSLFRDGEQTASVTIRHSAEELSRFVRVADQAAFREAHIREFLDVHLSPAAASGARLDAVVGRGGLLRPLASGVYAVNDPMIEDLSAARYGEHASNLGAVLARAVAAGFGCPAFIVDPVVVDELDAASRYSGIPQITRRSIFHALNQKAVARRAAAAMGRRYEECRLIVAHLGGGITVGVHLGGRVVDVNNGLDGDGPFSPERSGSLPAGQLVGLTLELGEAEVRRLVTGGGGLVAYCGTNSVPEILDRIDRGDTTAAGVFEAMVHQISKEIAMHGATLRGAVDRIILTGGMAESRRVTDEIIARVGYLAPVDVYPGEGEMEALAQGALRVLGGEEPAKEYRHEPR